MQKLLTIIERQFRIISEVKKIKGVCLSNAKWIDFVIKKELDKNLIFVKSFNFFLQECFRCVTYI